MNLASQLSQRLEYVASFITRGSRFADIGSDHAYIPCYVCQQDDLAEAVAGEVADAPFRSAQATISQHGLTDRVSVRHGNGLDVLESGEVDSVVLAGMGGTLIKTILDDGQDRLSNVGRIIAQPNVAVPIVRHWLEEHGYPITNEGIIEENGHIYEIIVADKDAAAVPMTEKQLLFGPYLLQQKTHVFYRKWYYERAVRRQIIEQMKQAAEPDTRKLAAVRQELAWIEEVLDDGSCHTQR
ncbi:tRNA (adenine(22)-N(1))-methyltransferase TrmK [Barrientosiimonas marina]|uniref:tRNA (Adenine(22)-N(1))-methyltransferase n=1 Tax=Lentibacillus kimchii TaxID=1542911 RepID=A0ABW2UVZ1_9BACI